MLAQAIVFASEAFKNKKDKGGKPYILHLLRVMFSVDQSDEELMTIAILHDIVEDFRDISCPTFPNSIYDLGMHGFSSRVCLAIKALTHEEGVPYEDYINIVAQNEDARKVKLADLKDNSNYLRLKEVNEKSFKSMKKYHKAYIYLSNIK